MRRARMGRMPFAVLAVINKRRKAKSVPQLQCNYFSIL